MDLYVANCTNQGHLFAYKVPESQSPWQVPIPQGGQIKVPAPAGGFNVHQVNYIVAHHERYGMRKYDEVDRAGFVGLVYAVDRPVALGVIKKVYEHNNAVLTRQGDQNRRDAAIAADSQIVDAFKNAGLVAPAAVERGASEFEMAEIETKSNPSPEMGLQKIRVDRSGTALEARRGRRR
jgi:hypothetical protein